MAIVAEFAAAAFPAPTSAAALKGSVISGGYGKVIVQVVSSDPSSDVASMPVADAIIEVIASNGTAVAKFATDSQGYAHMGLNEGAYKLRVTARGFNPGGTTISVKNGTVQDVLISLTRMANH